ncbi:hypothetical protein [Methanobacterium sp.]|uniref:hypothetical protein n=1 Tax=Methanobacterium sp. TaxID=2164 RepID=UPI003C76F93A
METIRDGKMDDKGYAFTPLALLLMIPVVILAVSYNGIVNEVNLLSAIAIGGDVTSSVAGDIIDNIQQDTADAGRKSAFMAVQLVINRTNTLPDNNPFFEEGESETYILNNTVNMINVNLTSTCSDLEKQTGRTILINGTPIDSYTNKTANIFQQDDLSISQEDPYGFIISIPSLSIQVLQNSSTANQSVTFNTPPQTAYVSIEGLEDPYIWVNTKERNSSIIYKYPYYNTYMGNYEYHFADDVTSGKLSFLWECLMGANSTMGYRPYYFPDPYGLTFFDRLEDRNVSNSPTNETRMSTFILWDPLQEDHGNLPTSMLDHEYFQSVSGGTITANKNIVMGPDGKNFIISNTYRTRLGLSSSY